MEEDQQFCLRWNNHQSTLISVFDNLLASETLVDCTLAAEGKYLKAHKVVLSACSPYFANLLKEQYDKHPIFILKDVKYQELRYMMDYMYRGEVNISQDQLPALLKAAESLQIKGLSDNRPSVPNPEQQHQQQHQQHHQQQHQQHHRASLPTNIGPVAGIAPKYPGTNYTLEQTKRARMSGRTMGSIDTSELDSREGSSSPSRKLRKMRRKSNENATNDTHDNSNSSQLLQSNQQQQVANANIVAGLSGVGGISAVASALAASSAAVAVLHTGSSLAAAAVAPTSGGAGGGSSIKKTDSLKATSQTDAMNIIENSTPGGSNLTIVAAGSVANALSDIHHHHQYQTHHTDTTTGGDKIVLKQKLQQQQQPSSKDISANQSELVIEPKSEYDDDANDEAVEDLTLDEEDMGMEDLDQKAGPSQGGEGSSQGYAPWQQDQSQDELLLNTQEAQQRDPQDSLVKSPLVFPNRNLDNTNNNNIIECKQVLQQPSIAVPCNLMDAGQDGIVLNETLPINNTMKETQRKQQQQQQELCVEQYCEIVMNEQKDQYQTNELRAQTCDKLLASTGDYTKENIEMLEENSNSMQFFDSLQDVLSPLTIEYLEEFNESITMNGQIIDQVTVDDLITLSQYSNDDNNRIDNNIWDDYQKINEIFDNNISTGTNCHSTNSSSTSILKNKNTDCKKHNIINNSNSSSHSSHSSHSLLTASTEQSLSTSFQLTLNNSQNDNKKRNGNNLSIPSIDISHQRVIPINRNLPVEVNNYKCHLCLFNCSYKEILLEHFREKHPT